MIPSQNPRLLLPSLPRSHNSRSKLPTCGYRKIQQWQSAMAGIASLQPMPVNLSGTQEILAILLSPIRIPSTPPLRATDFLSRPARCPQQEHSGAYQRAIYPRLSMHRAALRPRHPMPVSPPCNHRSVTEGSRRWQIRPPTTTSSPSPVCLSTAGSFDEEPSGTCHGMTDTAFPIDRARERDYNPANTTEQ